MKIIYWKLLQLFCILIPLYAWNEIFNSNNLDISIFWILLLQHFKLFHKINTFIWEVQCAAENSKCESEKKQFNEQKCGEGTNIFAIESECKTECCGNVYWKNL